jgi:acyl-CoA synthetase (AMP-forming)/AMP-acid ligase II
MKASFNINSGDVVCMDFMNSEKFVFIWFGLWSIGAKPAFINYNLTGKALAHCIRVSTAKVVLVDTNVSENVTEEVRAELPEVVFAIFTPQLESKAMTIDAVREPDSARAAGKLQDMSMLIYTSGTTGLPKPAIVSWGKCINGSLMCSYWMGLKRSDVYYTVSIVRLGISDFADESVYATVPFLCRTSWLVVRPWSGLCHLNRSKVLHQDLLARSP